MRTLTRTVSLTLLLAACGGDDTGPVSMADAEAGCRAVCQHELDCGSAVVVDSCTASCVANVTGVVRADVFTDATSCRTALACGAADTSCRTCTPTASHTAFEARCRALYDTCLPPAQAASVCSVELNPDSTVGGLCALTPAIMDELTACLPDGTTCATATTCLQNVLRAYGITG
ncbi:MAG: hypothetical protein R3B06_03195 [Kofleriaceae bacterium]